MALGVRRPLLVFSLASGLLGDIALMDWHQRAGLALLALLVFRIGWGLWGGRYARFRHYWTTPAAFLAHWRRQGGGTAHTSPGIVSGQPAVSRRRGTSRHGPSSPRTTSSTKARCIRYAAAELSSTASWLHRRLHWLILAAIGIHLAAQGGVRAAVARPYAALHVHGPQTAAAA